MDSGASLNLMSKVDYTVEEKETITVSRKTQNSCFGELSNTYDGAGDRPRT